MSRRIHLWKKGNVLGDVPDLSSPVLATSQELVAWLDENRTDEYPGASIEDVVDEQLDVISGTVEGEVATCARCGREITWEFDNDEDPYGMWSSDETLHSCTPGPDDEDRWHTPAPQED